MKKFLILTILILLTSFGIYYKIYNKPSKDNILADDYQTNDEIIKNERKAIDKTYGIKFLGYGKYFTDIEISKYLTDEELDKLEIVLHDGDEYYLIVPTSKTDTIIINNYENSSIIKSAKPGSPVLLRTNVSDIIPNTYISIKDENDKIFNFEPFVSLKDGSVMLTDKGYELEETFKSNVKTNFLETNNYSLSVPTGVRVEVDKEKISLYQDNKNILTTYLVTDTNYKEPLNEIKIDNKEYYLVYDSIEDRHVNRILLSIKLTNK